MRELTMEEIQAVSGGNDSDVSWGQVGAGLGAIGLGVAIASNPVGWLGATGAMLSSFGGGFAIGDTLRDS